MKTRIICIMLALLLLYGGSVAEKAPSNDVVYARKKATIYRNANDSDSVCTVYADYPLTILGSSGNYYHVRDTLEAFEG